MIEDCEREIRSLHEFFAEWYRGEHDRAAFERFEDVLDDEFSVVSPDGEAVDRATVLEGVREGYDRRNEFGIEIRAVDPVTTFEDGAVVRYEEWQSTPSGETGRASVACFRPAADAPEGVTWTFLQETWIEPPRS